MRLREGYDNEDNTRDRSAMRVKIRVETVEETIIDDELSYNSTDVDTKTSIEATPETTDNSQSITTYNPMADAPDPDIITRSY